MNVAVVGAGYWGPNLVRVFNNNPQVTAVTVCDSDRSRLERMKSLYPDVSLQEDLDTVLADKSIEAVVLALPTQLHYEATKKALAAGKHVFVEKPLARTVAEAEELCTQAEEAGKVLMVGHTFLYNSAVRKVKGYIDSGDMGEIYYIYGQRLNLGIVRSAVDAHVAVLGRGDGQVAHLPRMSLRGVRHRIATLPGLGLDRIGIALVVRRGLGQGHDRISLETLFTEDSHIEGHGQVFGKGHQEGSLGQGG